MMALSFNWHQPYMYLLAKTGQRLDIAASDRARDGPRGWDENIRPKPDNVRIVSASQASDNLRAGRYDLALCHNFADMVFVAPYPVRAVLLFHNRLSTELKLGDDTVDRDEYLESLRPLADRADRLLFVSESKRVDWGFNRGDVILPGVDLDDFLPYTGAGRSILRVGNWIRERDAMLGYSIQEEICDGFDHRLIGYNPTLPNAEMAESFYQLKAAYSQNRLYLNTTVDRYEDGYNLAMLEAMATGMPIVSTVNATSPITDGAEGYISDDIEYLRSRIGELMSDINLAKRIGANAKERLNEKFGIKSFIDSWNEIFESTCYKQC